VTLGLATKQVDYTLAFVHAELEYEVFVESNVSTICKAWIHIETKEELVWTLSKPLKPF
jgi:hypothetical protein